MSKPAESLSGSHVFHAAMRRKYPVVSHGEGIYLFDTQGNRYIDACGGAFAVTLGHGLPGIAEAMRAQIDRVAFAHRSQFTNAAVERLAELVAEMSPGGLDYLFPVSGGSEAVETAIKLAHKYHRERGRPEKRRIVGRWQSYHGNTLGALSAAGYAGRRSEYGSLLLDFPHVAPVDCYRCPFDATYPSCAVRCARDLERVIRQEGPHTIAAFIAEPIVAAAGGAPVPPPEYFRMVREICSRNDVLLIADEVVTGFGRTGRNFAVEHWNIVPDLVVTGKGMSSGYAPLAGVIASGRVADTIRYASGLFNHGYTYGGNPVAAAAGVFVLEYLRKHGLVQRSAQMGIYLIDRLQRLVEFPLVGDIRGLGLLVGIELVRDRETKAPFPPAVALGYVVAEEAMRRGLLVYPGGGNVDGAKGDHILLAPPFIVTEQQIDAIVDLLEETLVAVEGRNLA